MLLDCRRCHQYFKTLPHDTVTDYRYCDKCRDLEPPQRIRCNAYDDYVVFGSAGHAESERWKEEHDKEETWIN